MAFSYNKKNLANTTITGAITPTQTSVTVADATVFSYAFFYATLMPSNEMSNASNSEIVLVTNIQGNTLTLVRGQENTIARSFPYGAVITNGIYTRDIDYARSIGRKVFMARDDGTDDTNTSYQIIDPMIKNVPEEGSIITVEFGTPSYGAPTLGVNNGIGGLVQVSGTDIHITDSSGQIDSVEMYGDTTQTTYSGKNLFDDVLDIQYPDATIMKVTTDPTIGNVTMEALGSAGSQTAFFNIEVPDANSTYCLSGVGIKNQAGSSLGSDDRFWVRYRVSNNGTSWTGYYTIFEQIPSSVGQQYAFSGTISGYKYYQFLFYNYTVNGAPTGEKTTYTNIQLEKSSTPTSFEPYVGGTASPNPDYPQEVQTVTGRQAVTISDGGSQSQEFEINLGKNLLDKSSASASLEGYFNNVNVSLNAGTRMAYIPCLQNTTYTVSKIKSKRFAVATTTVVPDAGVAVSGFISDNFGTSITITTDSSAKYLCVFYYLSTSDTLTPQEILDTLQIEKGSTATTYAPYFTPIELCKIGTYQDKIYKSGEDWYVHKEINKVVFNGSEAWGVASTNPNMYYLANAVSPAIVEYPSGYSNYFTVVTRYPNQHLGELAIRGANKTDLMIRYDSMADVTALTTWFGTHNTYLYYPLATPTDTQITNSALIAQLNALYNMLPEGVADVVVTGDLPGSLTIKYYQQGTGTYTAPIVGGAEIDGGDNEQVVELDSYLPYRLVYDTNGYWRVLNKGPKVTTGAIADGAVTPEKLSVNPGKYSTAETIIGSWIDGKPIYRMIFQYTLSGSSWNTVGTITGIGEVTRIYGAYKRPNGIQTEFPRNTMDTYIETDGTIHVMDTEGNGGTVKCIVEYTKSN